MRTRSLVDLHTHTLASDGTFSPAELVRSADALGLAAVAVTDHDTVSGLEEALEAGRGLDIEVIGGCELSVSSKYGAMHLVGLWLPGRPGRLGRMLADVTAKRAARNEDMLALLCKQGFEISQEELEAKASGTVGRPHMAQVLVEKGYTDSVEHAFQNFLGPKGAAFVPKAKLSAPQAMDVLKAESATVILAHPGLLQLDDNSLDRLVRELASQGLDGLEVHYPEHDAAQTAFYLELAARHGLAVSGGTDFHGQVKPGLELGTGYGDFGVPVSVLEGLKARRQSRGLPV